MQPGTLSPAQSLVADDRDRDRAAQLLRGPRDRPVGGVRRDRPRARARDRLRPSQRHRGLRHRRPVLGHEERPSWAFLLLVGLIGGGPTFFGTLLGQAWVSEAVSIAFLALAAGSILYVVIELLGVCRNLGHKTVVAWGLTLGLMLGFATDFVLVAAGA